MKILLDTQCFLWFFAEPERLNSTALTAIEDPSNEIYLSSASAWEIAIKWKKGKLKLPEPPDKYIRKRLKKADINILPISLAHALGIQQLPDHHKDPFDRILISQANYDRLTLMTADSLIFAYKVKLIKAGK